MKIKKLLNYYQSAISHLKELYLNVRRVPTSVSCLQTPPQGSAPRYRQQQRDQHQGTLMTDNNGDKGSGLVWKVFFMTPTKDRTMRCASTAIRPLFMS